MLGNNLSNLGIQASKLTRDIVEEYFTYLDAYNQGIRTKRR